MMKGIFATVIFEVTMLGPWEWQLVMQVKSTDRRIMSVKSPNSTLYETSNWEIVWVLISLILKLSRLMETRNCKLKLPNGKLAARTDVSGGKEALRGRKSWIHECTHRTSIACKSKRDIVLYTYTKLPRRQMVPGCAIYLFEKRLCALLCKAYLDILMTRSLAADW